MPTLAFPALFFLLFVAPRSDADPTLLLASFTGFAVLAVAFFQFGVGIAAERESPWERFVRTLPLRVRTRFAARVLSAALFGVASAALVVAAALATTDAQPDSSALVRARRPRSLLGALPFALLGIALGYWASPRGALPVANILYLVLAFAGGLWTTPRAPSRLPSRRSRRSSPLASSGTCCGARPRGTSGGRATGFCSWRGRVASSAWSPPGATGGTRGGGTDDAETA